MATRTYTEKEFDYLKKWLDANQDSASEKMTGELAELIAKDYPANKVMPLNSCMAALHIALQIIGVGPGDEVIVDPIVTFAGMSAMYNNAVPVFADVDIYKMNVDPESVSKNITPRTKAIICTHHFGNMVEIEKVLAIAKEHNIPVIEDCAHSLFATRNGKYAGLFADFSSFSFNHRKQLSTGHGGFLLINKEEYADKAKFLNFGRIPERLTWNYHMPGLIAGLAMAQWEHSKGYVKKDHELAKLFTDAVDGCEWLTPQQVPKENWCAYHIWAAVYKGDDKGIDYKDFMKVLKENGADYFLPSFIPYGTFGMEPSPVYLYPIFNDQNISNINLLRKDGKGGKSNYTKGICPNAEYLVPRMLNTVLSPIQDERVKKYAEGLNKTIKHFS